MKKKCMEVITMGSMDFTCLRERKHRGLHRAEVRWGVIKIRFRAKRGRR